MACELAKMGKTKAYLVLLNVLFCSNAWAAEHGCDPRQSQFQCQNLITPIAIIGKENRETYPAYARRTGFQMSNFSGTVEFHCGNEAGGANLVSSNGCLALDSHAFFKRDPKTRKCLRFLTREEIGSTCYFQTVDAFGRILGQRHPVDPVSLKLPTVGNHCDEPETYGNDWAVIKARYGIPANLAKPYPIFDTSVFGTISDNFANVDLDHRWKVTVASMGADNFEDLNAPTICDGEMGDVETERDSRGNLEVFHTNSCSAGHGTSGAGVVILRERSQVPALLGIVTVSKSEKWDGQPYGNENFSAGPLIRGEFLEAINSCRK